MMEKSRDFNGDVEIWTCSDGIVYPKKSPRFITQSFIMEFHKGPAITVEV